MTTKIYLDKYKLLDFSEINSQFFTTYKRAYLNKCHEIALRNGEFSLVCFRCFKPIKNLKKLILDPHSKILYGQDCHRVISERQSKRVYIFDENGRRFTSPKDSLIEIECMSCSRKFFINKEYSGICGVNSRCCFCCEFTLLVNKAASCSFENYLRNKLK